MRNSGLRFLRFVADNPMLDPRQIGPVVDYLQFQKFEGAEVEGAPGVWRHEPPPQPGLSMSGPYGRHFVAAGGRVA